MILKKKSFEKKLLEKEKMLVTNNFFLFSHQVVYPTQNKFQLFSQI